MSRDSATFVYLSESTPTESWQDFRGYDLQAGDHVVISEWDKIFEENSSLDGWYYVSSAQFFSNILWENKKWKKLTLSFSWF